MISAQIRDFLRSFRRDPVGLFALGLLTAIAGSGCAAASSCCDIVLGRSYQPRNYYNRSNEIPQNVRRVVVLPLASTHAGGTLESGVETLEPILKEELGKSRLFEWVYVSPTQLRDWTGKRVWRSDEKLPAYFFSVLLEETDADAVLFCQLTDYRPYNRLAVGWKLKLLDTREPARIYWAVDEVFDAGEPTVINAARRYYKKHWAELSPVADSRSILVSPRAFAHYSAHSVITTLAKR